MKNVFKIALISVVIFSISSAHAQTLKDSITIHKNSTATKKVIPKTAQARSKSAAAPNDKKVEGTSNKKVTDKQQADSQNAKSVSSKKDQVQSTAKNKNNTTPTAKSEIANNNVLTDAEKKEGWQLLFDGRTKTGWHTYRKTSADDTWDVVDGTLHVVDNGRPKSFDGSSDLTTDQDFRDFDLRAEWKISVGGNSGIMFHVQENYNPPYLSGPEMQVLDNDNTKDGQRFTHRAGDLVGLVGHNGNTVKPVGEWNQIEIICKDGEVKLFQNGVMTGETKIEGNTWTSLFAGNRDWVAAGFGTAKSGKINLQNHSDETWFRNIKIKVVQ